MAAWKVAATGTPAARAARSANADAEGEEGSCTCTTSKRPSRTHLAARRAAAGVGLRRATDPLKPNRTPGPVTVSCAPAGVRPGARISTA
jgi:hypothetical protein